jgi:hypothetical protein
MAQTLIEAAKLNTGLTKKQAVIEIFAASNGILTNLPFSDIPGNSIAYNIEETLPGVGFRGVNEGFDESTGILNQKTEKLVIAGGDADVDRFIDKTMGSDQRAIQESGKVKAMGLAFARGFIKGDSDANPKEYDGIQKRIGGPQLFSAGNAVGGAALSVMLLDEAIDAVYNPTHIIMNKTMRRYLTKACKDPQISGTITMAVDAAGRQVRKYNDLPIIEMEKDNMNEEILDFDEADGTAAAAACTSIYVVSMTEETLCGIQNGGIDVRDLGELETKPSYRTRVEWFVGVVIYHPRAAARIAHIKKLPFVA